MFKGREEDIIKTSGCRSWYDNMTMQINGLVAIKTVFFNLQTTTFLKEKTAEKNGAAYRTNFSRIFQG